MTNFIAEVEFKTRNWDTITVEAEDTEQAIQFVREQVLESVDDVSDVSITSVKEVVIG